MAGRLNNVSGWLMPGIYEATHVPTWVVPAILDMLQLYPARVAWIEDRPDMWRLVIHCDNKQSYKLGAQVEALARLIEAEGSKIGVTHGNVGVVLQDDYETGDIAKAWGWWWDAKRGFRRRKGVTAANCSAAPGGWSLNLFILLPEPDRAEDRKGYLWFHPPQADKRWRASLQLLPDSERDRCTMLCDDNPLAFECAACGIFKHNLQPAVAQWCRNHLQDWRFLPQACQMLFLDETDRLLFRLRWF